MPDNIVLIGFSGTGKSSVGRVLASTLGWPLVDTDQQIVARFGKSIAAVFAIDGEAAFRTAERDLVQATCAGTRQIISLGGGATVDPTCRERIQRRNFVVRLSASPETILNRLRASPNAEERPMLQSERPHQRIRDLLAKREDSYAIANLVVDTEGRSIDEVAAEILQHVREERP